jgi:hypothetical protein
MLRVMALMPFVVSFTEMAGARQSTSKQLGAQACRRHMLISLITVICWQASSCMRFPCSPCHPCMRERPTELRMLLHMPVAPSGDGEAGAWRHCGPGRPHCPPVSGSRVWVLGRAAGPAAADLVRVQGRPCLPPVRLR